MSFRSMSGALLLLTSGCALLSKSEPAAPRYFSAEAADRPARAAAEKSGQPLRLGTITSGADIRENLVFRRSDFELGYDEDHRWTEKPEVYLRRSLARMLFEERGFQRVVSGRANTLEVELAAFEEVLGPQGKARARAVVVLHDERAVLIERTLTVEEPVGDSREPEDVVRALSAALARLVEQIGALVAESVTQ